MAIRIRLALPLLLLAALLLPSVNAYFNATYLNTTVVLNPNNSAHVVESVNLYISNTSFTQYAQDRQAINFTLSNWQNAVNTNLLVEHILNPKSSVYGFTFLPGPITSYGTFGDAQLTLSYYVKNITTSSEISPRRFEYTFNNSVFNFLHTASGQTLPANARLNIIVPSGAQIVAIYPVPDSPRLSFISNYTGSTTFSWYSADPLSSFTFSYILVQTPGQEVSKFFSNIFSNYSDLIFLLAGALVLVLLVYLYIRVSNAKV
ncbi:MAG: hypothetical protein KGH61_04870 [Candidatus Micrarchaeota archaeon]|nr:hypothetical protein [Candidatus Micrarchaeota archaeon]MDE1848250.1 hypothetical protein [Candidatus Micrarchaeota archaeon]MDE1864396.1 hypothetical protein [Candidatus Micrarchaeota archaeon]